MASAYLRDFQKQRSNAKCRGILWCLTFDEWLDWWKASGKLNQRGCHKGGYVMGRKNDTGPYSLNNIICISNAENNVRQFGNIRGSNNPNAKLSLSEVGAIRRSVLSAASIAVQYGVSASCIKRIRRNETWSGE